MSELVATLTKRKTAVTTGASLPVIAFLFGAVVFLVIGSLVSPIFAQQTVAGLSQGAIFGSLALALVLIYRATVVIVTIGLFILIDGVVTWIWGADLKFMEAPFGNAVYHAGGVAFSRQDIGVLATSIVSVIALWALFQFTKLGLGMRAAALRPA